MKKFEIVSQKLKEQITSGVYTQGQTLPTEEELSEIYSVSRQTVRKALDILVAEELISKKQGSGSTVRTGKSSKKSFLIAVIATYIDDYIFPGQLRAVESVLSANGYTPILAATGNKVYNERAILKDMLKKPIDGLLIEGTKTAMPSPNLDLYDEIYRRNLPVVFFNACCHDIEGAVSVCADDYQGGYDLVKLLFEKGHRNIAGIFKSDDLQGHERYLGFISAFKADLAMSVIQAKAINQLRDALQNEPHQHIKAAACYALGHIGRHSDIHALEVSNANVLSLLLFYYMDPNSNDDLKEKAKKSLKKIIDSCTNLTALEPLIGVAPEKILKHILTQYVTCLKDNKEAKRNFINGGLQKLQEIKVNASGPIQQLISDINSYFDDTIVKYYSPDYATNLLNKIDNYQNLG